MKLRLLILCLWLTPMLHPQEFVKVQIVEKGKVIEVPFSLVFLFGDREIEPLRFQNGFVVPPEIAKVKFVDVRDWALRQRLFLTQISPIRNP
jgi:hypothetical protein